MVLGVGLRHNKVVFMPPSQWEGMSGQASYYCSSQGWQLGNADIFFFSATLYSKFHFYESLLTSKDEASRLVSILFHIL